jgi:hypothetical protein
MSVRQETLELGAVMTQVLRGSDRQAVYSHATLIKYIMEEIIDES